MTVTTVGSAERLDIGQALQDGLNVLLRNFGALALLGVVLAGVPLSMVSAGAFLSTRNAAFALLTIVGAIAFFIGRPILFGAVMFLTVRELEGRRVTLQESLAAGLRRWGTMLGLTIWTGLLIGLGLILLIVPGIFFALQWAVAGPIVVLGGRGISDSMDESARITKGRRWPIFLFCLVVFVGFLVASLLLVLAEGVLALLGLKLLATLVASPLSSVLLDIAIPLVSAILYHRLRGDTAGGSTAVLAEVFA